MIRVVEVADSAEVADLAGCRARVPGAAGPKCFTVVVHVVLQITFAQMASVWAKTKVM
jgi:hypothetical protein